MSRGENIEQRGPWTLTYKRANGTRGTNRYTTKEKAEDAASNHGWKIVKLERGKTTYAACYTDEYKQRHSRTFSTKAIARDWLQTEQHLIAIGQWTPPNQRKNLAPKRTVEDVTKEWLTYLEENGRTESTIKTHESRLNSHILPALGKTPIADLTKTDIEAFYQKLRQIPSKHDPKAKTNGILTPVATTLKTLLNYALEAEYIDKVPIRHTPHTGAVRNKDETIERIEPEQVKGLYDAMPEEHRLSIYLAVFFQLRIGEVLGLQRRDLDLKSDRRTLSVNRQWNTKSSSYTPPKTKAGKRVLAMLESLIPLIRDHLDKYVLNEPTAPIFPSVKDKRRRMGETTLRKKFNIAREKINTPTLRFHSLRKTGLSLYGEEGATNAELLKRGGHSDTDVAMMYQIASQVREADLVARLDGRVAPLFDESQE